VKNLIVVNDSVAVDGGASQVAIASALGCAQAGWNVHFFAAIGPADPQLLRAGVKVTCLDQRPFIEYPNKAQAALDGICNFKVARRLRALLAEYSPADTVVHLHSYSKALSPVIFPVLKRSGHRWVSTLHEYFLACPNGGFYDYQKNEICFRKSLSGSCLVTHCDTRNYFFKLYRVARVLAQRFIYRVPHSIANLILLSPLSERWLDPYLSKKTKRYYLDNPISATDQGRAAAEKGEHLLFVGRLSAEKGVLQLAKAAQAAGVPLRLVGDGPLRAELEKILPPHSLLGWMDRAGVVAQMRQARALVFPSVWLEVQPLVPIEAAAQGLPSVLSDCTASSELFPDAERGLHFPSQNIEKLVEVLRRTQDSALIQKLSQNAYDWYWKRPWSIDRHTQGLAQIYSQIFAQDV
jgi:glycosyltransferase involved in cell wall biosynthesis